MTLTEAIFKNDKETLLSLIQGGEDVNEIDIYGYPPLMEAAIFNSKELSEILIEHGADVNLPDLTGGSALHWAVENNNLGLVELLLKKGANANAYTLFSQPVLVIPLLREQKALKQLLYKYRADLNFAQDYINAKLVGHRFELLGRVYIVDNKGKFIEIDFEGFILEFTVAIIQDSLRRYIYHYAARHLRRYFDSIRQVIKAMNYAGELLRYQQYMTDLGKHQQRINKLLSRDLVVIPVGYAGHAITMVCIGDVLVLCDRGEKSLDSYSVIFYRMKNYHLFTTEFKKNLIYTKQSKEFIESGIHSYLGLHAVTHMEMPSQITGNCSWANVEAVIPSALFLLTYQQRMPKSMIEVDALKEEMYHIFLNWREWDKERALDTCIESFNEASPARKASKASILAAVLFQTCKADNAHDLARANKMIPVLRVPEYQYILKSYINVYHKRLKTPEGKNLMDILELCGFVPM